MENKTKFGIVLGLLSAGMSVGYLIGLHESPDATKPDTARWYRKYGPSKSRTRSVPAPFAIPSKKPLTRQRNGLRKGPYISRVRTAS
jgi:hypothetical protein